MSYRDDVIKILDECDNDTSVAAGAIYEGPKEIALYVIMLGLETIKSKRRRTRRRELREEIKPQFKAGKTTGSVTFTAKTKERIKRNHSINLFGDDGWQIGGLNLGDMTKEQLLAQAANEQSSAKGSLRNAQFYTALAEPLAPGQTARTYWKSETARKMKGEIWKSTEGHRPDLV